MTGYTEVVGKFTIEKLQMLVTVSDEQAALLKSSSAEKSERIISQIKMAYSISFKQAMLMVGFFVFLRVLLALRMPKNLNLSRE